MTVFWRGKGSAAGRFAEAKDYSHWRLAYLLFGKESMALKGKLVLLGVLFDSSVTINPQLFRWPSRPKRIAYRAALDQISSRIETLNVGPPQE